jgi:hypothetical protein
MIQRAVLAVTMAVAPTSSIADLKGAALFDSFKPQPVYTAVKSTANDNAAAAVVSAPASPALSSYFFKSRPAPQPAPQAETAPAPAAQAFASASASEQPASGKRKLLKLADDKAVGLIRKLATAASPAAPSLKAEVNVAALPRPRSNKDFKPSFRVERVDMASVPGLTRDSTLEQMAAVYQAEQRRMEAPPSYEKPRIVNPRHDEIRALFRKETALMLAQQGTPAAETPAAPQASGPSTSNLFNLSAVGAPGVIQQLRPEAPQQPSRQAQNVTQQRAPRVA